MGGIPRAPTNYDNFGSGLNPDDIIKGTKSKSSKMEITDQN